jgi:hypothetical protein
MKQPRRVAYVIVDELSNPVALCMSKWAATHKRKAFEHKNPEDRYFVCSVPLDRDMFLVRRYSGGRFLISTGPRGQLEPMDIDRKPQVSTLGLS